MHHVAIMKPAWRLIAEILAGRKTIESRWYVRKSAPWDTVKAGDTVYFKDSGGPIIAKAMVIGVMQLELPKVEDVIQVVERYGDAIGLPNRDPRTWERMPKYCILIGLINPEPVVPFQVSKEGFGSGDAWLTVPDISQLKIM